MFEIGKARLLLEAWLFLFVEWLFAEVFLHPRNKIRNSALYSMKAG